MKQDLNKTCMTSDYEIELGEDDNFFENSNDLYVYYFVRDKDTKNCIGEGVSVFDATFMGGILETLSLDEQKAHVLTYLNEHVQDLLDKKSIHLLHPYIKDLVMGSVESSDGMYFVNCYEEMNTDERAFYTEDVLDFIQGEIEKEGLCDYIEVGGLYTKSADGVRIFSKDPVITVYMDTGTLFDLSENKERLLKQTKDQSQKLPLEQQISAAQLLYKERPNINPTEHERM